MGGGIGKKYFFKRTMNNYIYISGYINVFKVGMDGFVAMCSIPWGFVMQMFKKNFFFMICLFSHLSSLSVLGVNIICNPVCNSLKKIPSFMVYLFLLLLCIYFTERMM